MTTSMAHAEPGVTASQLLIGSSLAMSGPLAGAGVAHTAGLNAAFKAINSSGGISGRQLKLVSLDDGYVPARTVENTRKLLEEQQVFALVSSMGTGNTAAILPMVEKAEVPLVGPVTGAASLRKPGLKNVFHVRASYRDEIERLMQQLLSWGLHSLAFVYLDNPFGQEVLADAEAATVAKGAELAGKFALAVDGSNGEELARKVQAIKPSAVVLGTTGTANTAFLQPLRTLSPNTPVAGLSVSVLASELPKLGRAAKGVALTQVLPDASSGRLAAVRNYQAAMRAAGAEAMIGSTSFEGWVNGQVLIEGLRRTNGEFRRDRLRAALASMRRLDLGEFVLGYGPQAPYVASQFIDLAILGPDGKRSA
ncbi:ABC transporter substrate-binding protein [Ideonella sp. DXS29W]|uniref:ABC transporter substrate-binding protein n=1 Tax=Ideonella lacteola TaxID=2984193 RepID=A0ABU9BL86_9BURK